MEGAESAVHHGDTEQTKKHWEHPCKSCHHNGSTTFMHDGRPQNMDVYSCDNHTQPGTYGRGEMNMGGGRVVVRYAQATRDSIGEISYELGKINLDKLRGLAKNRQGSSDYTPAQIAIGKIL